MRALVGGSVFLLMAACAGRTDSSAAPLAAHCNEKGDEIPLDSVEAMERHLIGQWTLCSGSAPKRFAHDGIEFAANGHWYFLQRDGSGALTRKRGYDASGRWHPGNFTMSNTGFNPIVDLHVGQQTHALSVAFQGQPGAMRIEGWDEGPIDYVPSVERPLYAGPLPPAPPPSFATPPVGSHSTPPPTPPPVPRFTCSPGPELRLGHLFFAPEVDYVARHLETWVPNGKHTYSEERGVMCGKAKNRSACLAALVRARDSVHKPERCHSEPDDPACSLRSVVITRGGDARVLRSASDVRAQLGPIDSSEEARWLLELTHQGSTLCYAHSDDNVAPFHFTFTPPCQGEKTFIHHATVDANGVIEETREPTTEPRARWCNRPTM